MMTNYHERRAGLDKRTDELTERHFAGEAKDAELRAKLSDVDARLEQARIDGDTELAAALRAERRQLSDERTELGEVQALLERELDSTATEWTRLHHGNFVAETRAIGARIRDEHAPAVEAALEAVAAAVATMRAAVDDYGRRCMQLGLPDPRGKELPALIGALLGKLNADVGHRLDRALRMVAVARHSFREPLPQQLASTFTLPDDVPTPADWTVE